MLKIAKTAAFVLAAMAPVLAVAQGSQGRPERKPSPASSAPLAPQSLVRPTPSVQASPVTPPTLAATSVPAPAAQPVVNPTPSPEATATVHYAQGQLTVISKNASLGTVLKLIAAKTGAIIDLAPELQNEPVIAQMGPSAVREVLTGLLDSPKIDYIIMGTSDTPGSSLERIVVRTRQSFARTAMVAGRPSQPRSEDVEAEAKLNANGRPAAGAAPATAPLTQEQLMENWKKIREEKRLAEIERQRQDRENEKTQVQVEPQPQPEPQPDNPPTDNPPLK